MRRKGNDEQKKTEWTWKDYAAIGIIILAIGSPVIYFLFISPTTLLLIILGSPLIIAFAYFLKISMLKSPNLPKYLIQTSGVILVGALIVTAVMSVFELYLSVAYASKGETFGSIILIWLYGTLMVAKKIFIVAISLFIGGSISLSLMWVKILQKPLIEQEDPVLEHLRKLRK
jgi:hypothetical protein